MANEGITRPIKNKEKEKVVEDFINNKVSCKAMVLRYILVWEKKKGQYSFTKEEEKITKRLKNLTLLPTNLKLTKVSKPLSKMFVHQTESVVINLEGLTNKRVNGFDLNDYKLLSIVCYSREDVNKLAKDGDMAWVKGKQVSTKTKKAWREKKTSSKTSRAGIG